MGQPIEWKPNRVQVGELLHEVPIHVGQPIEWKLGLARSLVPAPSSQFMWDNQLNGNPVSSCRLAIRSSVPIHVGQPIEWKPRICKEVFGDFLVPIHVEQPIEWKLRCAAGEIVS